MERRRVGFWGMECDEGICGWIWRMIVCVVGDGGDERRGAS
jgi:hypothetical protein